MSDFLMSEIRALAELYKGVTWNAHAVIEPGKRVKVLIDSEGYLASEPSFMVRHKEGWHWVTGKADAELKAQEVAPYSWKSMITELSDGEKVRLPVAEELLDGGWVTEDDRDSEAQPEQIDEAKAQLDLGFAALEAPAMPNARTQALMRADVHFMASIAVSLYELVALHKKYDFEGDSRMELVAEPSDKIKDVIDDVASKAVDQAVRQSGTIGGTDFPWAR